MMSDSSPPLPVICEKCRATGFAGDEAFAAIPDLLDFEPVPRRAHANGWSPEHQRAFIAALAITGSPRQAARYVGRAAFGAETLRTAKGGRSFASAWDSALDLARDRELSRLHENLGELARQSEEANAQARAAGRLVPPSDADDGEEDGADDVAEIRARLVEKLQKMRKQRLCEEIIPFPEKRAAWILLNGAAEIEAIENGTWSSDATYPGPGDGDSENAPSSSPTPIGAPPSRHPRVGGDPASPPETSLPSPDPDEDQRGPRVTRL